MQASASGDNQLDLYRTVLNIQARNYARRAKRLTDILGDDHDLSVMQQKLLRYNVKHSDLEKEIAKRRNICDDTPCGWATNHTAALQNSLHGTLKNASPHRCERVSPKLSTTFQLPHRR